MSKISTKTSSRLLRHKQHFTIYKSGKQISDGSAVNVQVKICKTLLMILDALRHNPTLGSELQLSPD